MARASQRNLLGEKKKNRLQNQKFKVILDYSRLEVTLEYVRTCFKNSNRGWHDGSASKGVCCQADNLNLIPTTQMVEGKK